MFGVILDVHLHLQRFLSAVVRALSKIIANLKLSKTLIIKHTWTYNIAQVCVDCILVLLC